MKNSGHYDQEENLKMKSKLEKEFEYYLKNQDELVKEHNGKYLVIVGHRVVGAYDSYENAYIENWQKYRPGTFLIQKCSPGAQDYTLTFYSNVAFGTH